MICLSIRKNFQQNKEQARKQATKHQIEKKIEWVKSVEAIKKIFNVMSGTGLQGHKIFRNLKID